MNDFSLTYNHYQPESIPGLPPQVKIHLRLTSKNSTNHIINEISEIKYNVRLFSLNPTNFVDKQEMILGNFQSPNPLFIREGSQADIFFYLTIHAKALEKILDLIMKKQIVALQISSDIYYHVYTFRDTILYLQAPVQNLLVNVESHGPRAKFIEFSRDDISKFLGIIHYTDKLTIELPLFNDISTVNQDIKAAINSLIDAAHEFEHGNYHGVLLNIRNAITNHLTEVGMRNNRKKRFLKTDLKKQYIATAPTTVTKIYEEIFSKIESELLAVLDIVHKFVHEDDHRLKLVPMAEDLELTYFSTALIIRYLTRRLGDKLATT
ncbi:MAG: hypothetical protein M3P08_04605 [Thermoproteota archaeon]|nr:hypothetical protein [Thermoproteota archaeon]